MSVDEKAKPWRCTGKGGHYLGIVRRSGRGVTQLLLYRYAIDGCADQPADVDVIAVIEGHVVDVRCSVCGSLRTWVPGEAALNRLLASHKLMMDRLKEDEG